MGSMARSTWMLRLRGFGRRRRISIAASAAVLGRLWIHGRGAVRVDADVVLDASDAPIELHAHDGAEIRIGQAARIGSGSSLEAIARISVGPRSRLGRFVKVMDNNFHPVDSEGRLPASRPVTIGADAEVGDRAILLPGAWIAPGAKVPAGAVVSRRFGPLGDGAAGIDEAAGEAGPRVPARVGPLGKLVGALDVARGAWYLRACQRGKRVHAGGKVIVRSVGRIRIGSHAVFLGGMIASSLDCGPSASIEVGNRTIFNYGVALVAECSIRVGDNCQFGSYVRINDVEDGRRAPVVIGDDVWVAHGASIGPGVTVGTGSVISAGSRVTTDVPPYSLVIGNPARSMSLGLRSDRVHVAALPEGGPLQ